MRQTNLDPTTETRKIFQRKNEENRKVRARSILFWTMGYEMSPSAFKDELHHHLGPDLAIKSDNFLEG